MIGTLVLSGWAFDVPILTRFLPGFASMAPNTAFAFVLVGFAIWPLSGPYPTGRGRALAFAAGSLVALLGALTLIEYRTGSSFGIDQFLFKDPRGSVQTVAPARMTEATAASFLFLGGALALMAARRGRRSAQALSVLACLVSLLALAAYGNDVRALNAFGPFSGIAFLTVVTFLVAVGGVLAADPVHGLAAVLTSPTVGGTMARRILPWAVAIPIVLGWLENKGKVAGLYRDEFGDALLMVASIVIIGAVILWQGAALGRVDRDRLQATGAASDAAESVRKLSRAVEQSPVCVVITDTKGDIEYVNPKFTEVTGFSSDEVLGMNPRILKSGELPPEVYRELWEAITAGREWRGEFHNRRKDGSLFWELASISPIFDDERRITHFVSVMEDITERKRTAESLAEKERHFRSLIENAQDIITIVDAGGVIRYQSPAAERILGRPAEEFLGRNVFEFVHPEDQAGVVEGIRRAVAGEPPQYLPFRFKHANGFWRAMEGVGKLLPGEEQTQIVVNSRDVTESRALEEQLRQSQKMEAVGRLAGGIAHDFNNLLTVITGYTDLATGRLRPDDPARTDLLEIGKASQRAADLTRQLLAFSRKQVLQPRIIDLNRAVKDTEKMLRRVIGEDIELVTFLADDLGAVKADTGQIEQVLLNLAVNSRDAMPKGGKLTIETGEIELDESYAAFHFFDVPPGRYVRLTVGDTGAGMNAKTLSRVFEPFFTTKEIGKGTGLGLSTVYGVVKQSGGHITAYSEPGIGTTFKVYLPRVEGAPENTAPPAPRAPQGRGTETVLVVEDEPAVRTLTCRSLEMHGYEVLKAATALEGLLVCEKHPGPIHLLLTDVVMPNMGGPELAGRARALRPGIKVLYMSGYTDDAIVHHGVLEKGTPFLEKPFTPRSLVQKVRDTLDAGE